VLADDVLLNAVRGISDLITIHGLINLDFADVRTVMNEAGVAMMGTGSGRGDSRAVDAARAAISSPLLEDLSIEGARGVLINITGGDDLTLFEVNEASTLVQEAAHEDANIIFGAVVDDKTPEGELRVTVIATGLDDGREWRGRDVGHAREVPVQNVRPLRPEPPAVEAPAPPPAQHAPENAPAASRPSEEAAPMSSHELATEMSGIVSPFEEDELDVPAFIRRRQDDEDDRDIPAFLRRAQD
jgi:cell division protein FtsZ